MIYFIASIRRQFSVRRPFSRIRYEDQELPEHKIEIRWAMRIYQHSKLTAIRNKEFYQVNLCFWSFFHQKVPILEKVDINKRRVVCVEWWCDDGAEILFPSLMFPRCSSPSLYSSVNLTANINRRLVVETSFSHPTEQLASVSPAQQCPV